MTLSAALRDRKVRDVIAQVAVAGSLVALLVFFVRNASENMVKAGIASGFDFLWRDAGIDIPFQLTGYTASSSILGLLWVAIVNTLLVSVVSIVAATLLGFLIGVARLSRNPMLSGIAGAYVELSRNIPLLFFVLIWYFGVIASLPAPRASLSIFGIAFLNNRGLTIPLPNEAAGFRIAWLVLLLGIGAQVALAWLSRRRQAHTGRPLPLGLGALVMILGLPAAAFAVAGFGTTWDVPALRGFNYRGGFVLVPEFVALFAALSTYTAAFVAEIVRAGILAVPKGQIEAAKALGLTPGQTLRLVTIPQALRVMVPPMTSQYLNIIKNSSFGAAIAYPDVVSLFMGSVLNNTGQAIEIIAITLGLYLSISLAVSAFMNWYNARIALVTR
ncbi:amino acid ABC transporter permease [uncultured Enterovirga sp.]|uniref:amino acid ABC transporter permease n=1 Tax=uncultured Enterovirga sp. TaxID=2026352 RepID=UPI0035CB2B40